MAEAIAVVVLGALVVWGGIAARRLVGSYLLLVSMVGLIGHEVIGCREVLGPDAVFFRFDGPPELHGLVDHAYCFLMFSSLVAVAFLLRALWLKQHVARESAYPICAQCGYNLTGLGGSRCPECGHVQRHHDPEDGGDTA